ncbi:MAG TPA: DUF1800 domain-containing protein [Mycobacteriales bacterium]|jgi:uncharacterized protein (DUF1800 family)
MAPKPMTAADVSRLLGRAAFGATEADLDRWTGKPYADLVDELLAVGELPVVPPQPDEARRLAIQGGNQEPGEARRWWLERMRTTPYPLLERVTLLWHNHFATGIRYPPQTSHLVAQNATIRTHALGDLHALVEALTVDPAMLFWLNGTDNATPHPNENYAREFFELFTLGTDPQVYTERDVREAARVFTGWIVNGGDTAQFVAARHDAKTKRVLGRTVLNAGDQEYKTLVGITLAQPASPRFFARKIVASLAYVPAANDPLVTKVANALRSRWRTADAVRALLLADEFRYASAARGRQYVRTPVETLVHAAKALGVAFDDGSLVWFLDRMGHSLFDPVDVSGWPLGRDWITPVAALARYDAALALFSQANADRAARTLRPWPASRDVTGWARFVGLPGVSRNTASAIGAYLRRAAKADEQAKQQGVLALLLSSPEWLVM